MTIAREEIFGPVLSILPYKDEDEAISIANDTEYGLSGYVSGSQEKAQKFAEKFPEFGLDLKTAEGRNLYGTQSLRRGAAQALVEAGWSIDDVKFFGRWLSDAIELYLLQVPIAVSVLST